MHLLHKTFITVILLLWASFFVFSHIQPRDESLEIIEVIYKVENYEEALKLTTELDIELISYSVHGISTFKALENQRELLISNGFVLNHQSSIARPWILPPKTTTDPYIGDQYALNMMDVHQAWTQTTGSSTVLIAIVDTGIDINHEEFTNRISHLSYNSRTKQVGLSAVVDDNGHGTMVAGVIGANKDNSKGIAGIVQHSPLLIIKANRLDNPNTTEDESKFFDDASIIEAIYYATNQGADVINLSLGSSSANPLTKDAIDYARSQGVIVVAAAGNDGKNEKFYPASFEGVISVGAVDSTKTIWENSNFNDAIDVVAPGVGIVTTFTGNGYGSATGTSLAAPQVTGVIALMLAYFSNDTDQMIIAQLIHAAMDQGSPGYDIYYGHGIINASDALAVQYITISFETFGGTQIPSVEVIKGMPFLIDDPEKTGYEFNGWYQDLNLTQPFLVGEDTLLENKTLYAKFLVETYTITFITDGAPINPLQVTYFDTFELPISEKEGYDFIGWFLDDTFETPLNQTQTQQDLILYAKFEIKIYTISFFVNQVLDRSIDVNHGSLLDLYIPESEYPFVNWYFDLGFKDVYEVTPVTSSFSLYAKFNDGTYQIIFYDYDLTTILNVQSIRFGEQVLTPLPPLKPNTPSFSYTFIGWSQNIDEIDSDLSIYPLYEMTYIKYSVRLNQGIDTVSNLFDWIDGGLIILDPQLSYEKEMTKLSQTLYQVIYQIIFEQEVIDQVIRFVTVTQTNPIVASLKPDVTTIEVGSSYVDPGVIKNLGSVETLGSVNSQVAGVYQLTYIITYETYEVRLTKFVYVLTKEAFISTVILALPPRKEVWSI